ncbi:ASKHA domain-containing protein [Desulfotignum phosphitoxidans]|uniref:Putative ferredoxin n=2 Tax=Desulfotignum phosphitoxidans TaxID=190898 RepID=S0G1A0_9BACT|nr:ASKHA domain-containing protein [Desulfotignum phosphitoxidans]ADB92523.1 putative ferredoxin [Desulfotignum phosphitoxidans DSM 13687]EMS77972.1 putative ferredoxin [Desulfotignum phosphitoxidans DSM 13687]
MVENIKVAIEPGGKHIFVEPGTFLLDALLKSGSPMQTACGGRGTCGKCRVRVRGDTGFPDEKERHHLTAADLSKGFRLSCCRLLYSDVKVELPDGEGCLPDGCRDKAGFVVRPFFSKLAVAIDIGTTTIKMEIINLPERESLASHSALNPQRVFGHDVMSRIHAARHPESSGQMTGALRNTVTQMILQSLAKIDAQPRDVVRIVISANTVMLHFFFGMDVRGLGKYPYTPESLGATIGWAVQYGLDDFGKTPVLGFPAISAYLGGDLVSGLLSTGVHWSTRNTILIDIGTNSEIILATPNGLLATSCAAGPALEGMNIEYGMTASSGAISGFEILDEIRLNVMGGVSEPSGLCGSGIVELTAELLRTRVVDRTGKMEMPVNSLLPSDILERLRIHRETLAFFLTESVCFTQKDVRQVQLAKAAILAGQKILREKAGLSLDEIESVVIAGEFGRHLNPEHLIRLGMMEPLSHAVFSFVGNSSLKGAEIIAFNPEQMEEARKIASRVEAFPLAMLDRYEQLFIESLEFPDMGTQ